MLQAIDNLFQRLRVLDSEGTELAWNKRSIKYNKRGDDYGYVRIPLISNIEVGQDYRLVLDVDIADTADIHLPAERVINFTAVDAGADKPEMTVVEGFENPDDYYAYTGNIYIHEGHTFPLTTSTDRLFGNGSMQLTYDFYNDAMVVITYYGASDVNFNPGDTVGFHVWGDMSYNKLYVSVSDGSISYGLPAVTLDFHGWRYVTVPIDSVPDNNYKFSGFMIRRDHELMGKNGGTIRFDNVLKKASSGIEEKRLANMEVRHAGDYIVVSADTWVQGVELIDVNGRTIKATGGNCLNVADVAHGVYLVRVHINGRTATHKFRL